MQGMFSSQHYFELDQLPMFVITMLIIVAIFFFGDMIGSYRTRRQLLRHTTLPNFPSSFRGLLVDDIHSSSHSTARAYPRTDLTRFERWQTFSADIHTAITDAMEIQGIAAGTTIALEGFIGGQEELVANELDVQQVADTEVHKAVIDVLKALRVQGRFYRSGTGKIEIIGEPDFCWIHAGTKHPKLVVRKSIMLSPLHPTPPHPLTTSFFR